MHRYILRRLIHLVPVLFVVSIVVFSITLLLPGDPTLAILGEQASQAERLALREKMGLDRPIVLQYATWLGSAMTGDLGRSLRTQEPVAEMLAARIPVTLQLTLGAIVFAVIIGVPLGIIAALKRNSWIDVMCSATAMSGVAMPYFWTAILLIILFSLVLRWLPPSGYTPFFSDPVGNLKLMILPTLTVGMAMSALVMRQTRTAMLQILSQDFIRTARAKGVSELRIVLRHALRNALIPVITVIGLQTGALVGGAVVTETVFGMPGLGRMVVEGIFERDFAAVQGAILVIVAGVLAVNLLTDLFYAALDRRIKL
jgi:peptide/nickel transport system permease protein